MNIKIADNPTITIEDCKLYAERKTALYHAHVFIKDAEVYRQEVKTAINDIAYGYRSRHYHVRITESGNIKVKLLSD